MPDGRRGYTVKLTKQGVRNLGWKLPTAVIMQVGPWECDHRRMKSCCKPSCGHYNCPCGIHWDEGAAR